MHEAHAGKARRGRAQDGDQSLVYFHGDHLRAGGGEGDGERTQTRPHLQDEISGAGFGFREQAVQHATAGQEVLPEPFARAYAEGAQHPGGARGGGELRRIGQGESHAAYFLGFFGGAFSMM